MKRLVLACALVCVAASAQTHTTAIYDNNILMADGSRANGNITIEFTFTCTGPNGITVPKTRVTRPVTGGIFSATLVPNDTCASTYYNVEYKLVSGPTDQSHVEYWIVPTSSTPVTIDQIRTQTVSPPSYQIPPSQLGGSLRGNLLMGTSGSWTTFGPCPNGQTIVTDSSQGPGWKCTTQLYNITRNEFDFRNVWSIMARSANGPPANEECNEEPEVGRGYLRRNPAAPNATVYVCANTAPGTYAWELLGAGGGGGGGSGPHSATHRPYGTDPIDYGQLYTQNPTSWGGLVWTNPWAILKLRVNGEIEPSLLHMAEVVQGLSSQLNIPATADMAPTHGGHGSALSGVATTRSPEVAAVGLYGQGNLRAGGLFAFGANLLARNDGNYGIALTGLEINTQNRWADGSAPGSGLKPDYVHGLFIRGISTQRPNIASYALLVMPDGDTFENISGGGAPKRTPFDYGLKLDTAASVLGVELGEVQDGNSQSSQPVRFISKNPAGTRLTGSIYQDQSVGEMQIVPGGPGAKVHGYLKTFTGSPPAETFVPGILPGAELTTGRLVMSTNPDKLSSTAVGPTDDTYPLGNGTAWQPKQRPNCTGPTNKLNYDAATNTETCEPVSGGDGGVPPSSFLYAANATPTFDNTTHQCGHGNITTQILDENDHAFEADKFIDKDSPFTVTYFLPSPRSGRITWDCWAGSTTVEGGGGALTSYASDAAANIGCGGSCAIGTMYLNTTTGAARIANGLGTFQNFAITQVEITGNSPSGASKIRMTGNNTTATSEFIFQRNSVDAGITNNGFAWLYNRDNVAPDQPEYGESFESSWQPGAPPLGLLERHGNFESVPGSAGHPTAFRPWAWVINLNTNQATFSWLSERFMIGHRAGSANDFDLTNDADGTQLMLQQRGAAKDAFRVLGGRYVTNDVTDALLLRQYTEPSAGTLTRNSPQFSAIGKYWSGAAPLNAGSHFWTQVTDDSPLTYWTEITNDGGGSISLGNNGFVGLTGVPKARITEPLVLRAGTYLSSSDLTDANTRKLIGLNANNIVQIDPDAIGARAERLGVGKQAVNYRMEIGGTPVNTVLFALGPSSLTSGDQVAYFTLPATTGSVTALNMFGSMTENLDVMLKNTNNSSSAANAKFEISAGGTSGGDPFMTWTVPGSLNATMGLDNSDSDKLRICSGDQPSNCTEQGLNMLTAGADTGAVGLSTNDLDGTPAIGKLTVKGRTNDGSTNVQVWRDSDEANVASLDTNGNLILNGTLSVATPQSFAIEDPVDTIDYNLGKAKRAMTMLSIDCITQGTGTVTGQLQECSAVGASCTDLDTDVVCDSDGAADDGSFTDAAIASGSWLRWNTTSVSGTPDSLAVTYQWR